MFIYSFDIDEASIKNSGVWTWYLGISIDEQLICKRLIAKKIGKFINEGLLTFQRQPSTYIKIFLTNPANDAFYFFKWLIKHLYITRYTFYIHQYLVNPKHLIVAIFIFFTVKWMLYHFSSWINIQWFWFLIYLLFNNEKFFHMC